MRRKQKKRRYDLPRRPELTVAQILAWVDFYHERTGRWPQAQRAGQVYNAVDEKWRNIDNALRLGLRGLTGKSSLARLLAQKRGVRNIHDLPRLTYKQILLWADAHHRRTGRWPRHYSGPIRKHRARPGARSIRPLFWVFAVCPAIPRWVDCSAIVAASVTFAACANSPSSKSSLGLIISVN